jgi:IPTL-CTERM motif
LTIVSRDRRRGSIFFFTLFSLSDRLRDRLKLGYGSIIPPRKRKSIRRPWTPAEDIGNIRVQRKVFVPDNDQFARWLNIFTNTGGSAQTVTAVITNDLGSDSNTVVVTSSNGNAAAEPTDSWVTTFQNYSGTTSSDPRLGHVVQGPGAVTPLAGIHFANGEDNPYWGYTFTLNPGQTKIIVNYVTGQPSKAAAAAKSAQIAGLPDAALQCLSSAERAEIVNFALPQPIPALGQTGLIALGVLLATIGLIVLRRM